MDRFFRGAGRGGGAGGNRLAEDEVAWCGPIATELRRGFVSAKERAKVLPLLQACHWLAQPDALFEEAGDLGYLLRRKGLTTKTFDLLIAAYAMKKKGIPLELVALGEL